jgi:outer membrane protein
MLHRRRNERVNSPLNNSIFKLALSTVLLSSVCVNIASAENLQDALISAYRNNPLLMAERARVRETDENYVQAQAAGRFNLNVDGSYGQSRTTSSSVFFSSTTDNVPRSGQLTIVQPLYQGGRVRGLKAQAKAGILAARQGLRNTEQNVLLAAATAYLDVLANEEAARIRRNNVKVLARQKLAAEDRFEFGAGTRTDTAQADSRLAAAQIGLANADAALASSRAAFVRYMGHVPESLSSPMLVELPETLTGAQLKARENNPQLIAARFNEDVNAAAIRVARANGRPTISLNGSLQGSRDTGNGVTSSEGASITAQIRVPIYSGGANRSGVRAAKQARIRSKFETREAEQATDQAVANLWAQMQAAQRTLTGSLRQVAAAEIAFEGVELEQQVGTRSTLDVLDAEQELLNAKLSVVQATRTLRATQYQMLAAMGGFDAYSLQLDVTHYDPQANFDQVTKSPFSHLVPEFVDDVLPKSGK